MTNFIIDFGGHTEASDDDPVRGRRVIATARTLRAMNEAEELGFTLLVRAVVPNPALGGDRYLIRASGTGQLAIEALGRGNMEVIDTCLASTRVYPYSFPEPFAAYLIPPDLRIGEEVWLEDVIEDVVASTWWCESHRLKACSAIWNGVEFQLQYDAERDDPMKDVVG